MHPMDRWGRSGRQPTIRDIEKADLGPGQKKIYKGSQN